MFLSFVLILNIEIEAYIATLISLQHCRSSMMVYDSHSLLILDFVYRLNFKKHDVSEPGSAVELICSQGIYPNKFSASMVPRDLEELDLRDPPF
jgi:hypothetical protein